MRQPSLRATGVPPSRRNWDELPVGSTAAYRWNHTQEPSQNERMWLASPETGILKRRSFLLTQSAWPASGSDAGAFSQMRPVFESPSPRPLSHGGERGGKQVISAMFVFGPVRPWRGWSFARRGRPRRNQAAHSKHCPHANARPARTYFLRTSFIPLHSSFAGAPFSHATPSTS